MIGYMSKSGVVYKTNSTAQIHFEFSFKNGNYITDVTSSSWSLAGGAD